MVNAIIKQDLTTPTPISAALDHKLSTLSNRCLRLPDRIEIDVDLYPETRRDLENRRSSIDNWLKPCGPEYVLRQVTPFYATLNKAGRDEVEREMAVRVYVSALSASPTFALRQACDRVMRGHWLPSPGEILTIVDEIAAPIRRQHRKITDVLEATLNRPTAEQRKSTVAAAMGKLKGMSQAGEDAEVERMGRTAAQKQNTETEAERLARWKSPMTLSEDTLRKFNDPNEKYGNPS